MDAPSRRAAAVERIRTETGIDEAMIAEVVHAFYRTVRRDPLLGPVFEAKVQDWDAHLGRMCEFWSSVALMSGVYHGQPLAKHMPLPIDAGHFDRWLAIFDATLAEVCPPRAAAHFSDRARRIAESLELGIAGNAGVLLKKGERFRRSKAAAL